MRRQRLLLFVIRVAGIPIGRALLAIDRDNAGGLLMTGIANAMRGDFARAERALTRLLEVDPNTIHGRLWLSRIGASTGRLADAKRWELEAVALDPENPLTQAQIEECNSASSRSLTLQFCDQVSTAAPRPTVARFGLGVALWGMERTSDALWIMERAIEEDPLYMPALQELLGIYRTLDDPPNELRVARLAAEIAADAGSQTDLALALISNGNDTEAEDCLRTATAMARHNAAELAGLGIVCQILGRADEASQYFLSSIAGRPKQCASYYWLSQRAKATEDDRPRIDRMKELFADTTLAPQARESLAYALGKSLEDLGDYEDAMRHFEEGNRVSYGLKFGPAPYELKSDADFFEEAKRMMAGESIAIQENDGNLSPSPIFIVGMIRSATTLMEQILSSHPKVGGAGEQPFWAKHHDDLRNDRGHPCPLRAPFA